MPSADTPIAVCADNLELLSARVAVPRYDRRRLSAGVVHISVGGFNRAHQAVYLDDLLGSPEGAPLDSPLASESRQWAECGIGLMPTDRRMKDVLSAQDFLYTVVERSASKSRARIVGSICGYIFAPDTPECAIAKMASSDCRIVSMTITEGGYYIHQGTGKFEADHPEVRFDLENPQCARSFLGLMCLALDRRRRAGLPPFTVLSCDNLQGNGAATRYVLEAFAELWNPELRQWIERNVTFPNSMVDRITPATTELERKLIEESFGVRDGWPVVTEPFRQWVIEDSFCNGRPAWERAGALMTGKVQPYETMKMRLLNGSHFAMAYMGAMRGFEFIHQIMEDPLMRRFVAAYMEAVSAAVPEIAGIDLVEYKATLLERFSNPMIKDQVERVCSEGSAKLPKFILPELRRLLGIGGETQLISLAVASWLHTFRRWDEQGDPLAVLDACAAEITRAVALGGADPTPALGIRSIFGEELPANPRFVSEVRQGMESLLEYGVVGTLEKYLTRVT